MVNLLLVISALCYCVVFGISMRAIFTSVTEKRKLSLFLALIAVATQLVSAALLMNSAEGVTFSFFAICLIVSAGISASVALNSVKSPNYMLQSVTYGFSSLLTIVITVIPADTGLGHKDVEASLPMYIHIGLSILAYCFLIISTLYAIQFHHINTKLKEKSLSLHSNLPPLTKVEHQQFSLMSVGVGLLTLALLTGFTFLDSMWSTEYAHKTFLSLVSWAIFVVLTLGHKYRGWRGNAVVISTVIASVLLTLGYFGSRFVREFILI